MAHRYSGSLAAIAATINSMSDTRAKAFENLGGRRVVVQVLLGAANKLLQVENRESEGNEGSDDVTD